jgi:cytoskeleton protein RodZ
LEPEIGSTPGERLARARAERSLTQQQAAEGLNLDVWVVEAIESNRFSALGPPVYAKGHLRKYAVLLGLPPEEVLASYDRLNDTPTVPDPIPSTLAAPVRGVRSTARKSSKVWIGIVAFGLLLALAIFLFFFRAETPQHESAAPAEPPAQSAEPATTQSITEPESGSQSIVEAKSETPVARTTSPVSAAPSASAAQQVAEGPTVTVRLEFSETSWTEVYDARGTRLMFDNGEAGRSRTLTGVAPLRVTVGLASGVKLEVNGRPAVIPRRTGRESARFTVAGDGSVAAG